MQSDKNKFVFCFVCRLSLTLLVSSPLSCTQANIAKISRWRMFRADATY